jgi:hypothetical protein
MDESFARRGGSFGGMVSLAYETTPHRLAEGATERRPIGQ